MLFEGLLSLIVFDSILFISGILNKELLASKNGLLFLSFLNNKDESFWFLFFLSFSSFKSL
jgi:hypothetical protein